MVSNDNAMKIGKEAAAVPNSEAAQSKDTRKTGHRFARGNSFGRGRPQGSRNKATIALQALLDEEGEQITRKAIEMALAGDSTALRLVLERLVPPVRERRLSLELPKIETPAGVLAAGGGGDLRRNGDGAPAVSAGAAAAMKGAGRGFTRA